MTTITIADGVSASKIEEIEALLNDVSSHDPNWNGVEFSIERGDFTCIERDDSAEAVILLDKINSIIMGFGCL